MNSGRFTIQSATFSPGVTPRPMSPRATRSTPAEISPKDQRRPWKASASRAPQRRAARSGREPRVYFGNQSPTSLLQCEDYSILEKETSDDDRDRIRPRRAEASARDAGHGDRRPDARASPHAAGQSSQGEHARVGLLPLRPDGRQRGPLRAPEAPADGVGGGRLRREARTAAGGAGDRHDDRAGAGAPDQGPA